MKYRINQRTGDAFSEIGIGTAEIGSLPHDEAIRTLKAAIEAGMRTVDLAAGNLKAIEYVGEAFRDCREEMIYQVHFGAYYETGEYGWTTDLKKVRKQVENMLRLLNTDYIDYGFIHCLDEEKDLDQYIAGGVLEYLRSQKENGTVRHLGLSSHTPSLVNKVLDMNLIDQFMFSVNPAYDFQTGEYANGSWEERKQLYLRAQKEGVGITVMKPFAGGLLLSENRTPLNTALSAAQCIEYALSQPGVLCAVCGISSEENVRELSGFDQIDPQKKALPDHLFDENLSSQAHCVYCAHCHPCPAGLNIALINKYYDLAKAGDSLAADHYRKLEKHASDCVQCSHCTSRCPFHTNPMKRMLDIAEYFHL